MIQAWNKRGMKSASRSAFWSAIDEWPELQPAFQTWLAPGNFDLEGRQRTRLSDLTRPILKQIG
jgi:hypothetical protein